MAMRGTQAGIGSVRATGAAVLAAAGVLALVSACGSKTIAIPPDHPVTRVAANPTASPTATPKSSAGPLKEEDLPDAGVLGKRWKSYVEPGGFGVVGNGSFAQAREIDELMAGLKPVGCPAEAGEITLPRPEYALEGSYRDDHESPGLSLVLQFGRSDDAKQFLDRLAAQFDACPPGSRDPNGPLTLDFQTLAMRGGRIAAVRQEHGKGADPNRYLVVAAADGERVGIVFVGAGAPSERDRIGRRLADWIAKG
jgi:hypothetical protein